MTTSTATPTPTPTIEVLQRQLEAAHRTIRVLKDKVGDLYNGGGSGIAHAVQRAQAREAELRRRQELTALRNAELSHYSAMLEGVVAARTRDLQVILDNVVFGFVVVNPDGTLREGATRSCEALLGRMPRPGLALAEALGFTGTQFDECQLQLDALFEDVLPESLLLDQLPRGASTSDGRRLHLDGRVIRQPDGKIDGLLLTISDITELEAAQRDNAHYRLLVHLLRNRETFCAFITDARDLLEHARVAIAGGDEATARRALHTVKGNAACFGLTDVAEIAHAAEDAPVLGATDLTRVRDGLAAFLAANVDVLGLTLETPPTVEISTGDLEALAGLAHRGAAEVMGWIERARLRPARSLLAPLEALVPRLAERAGKQVELHIEGGGVRVDAEVLGPIVRELGHVVRNAIDHGLESPEGRGTKPATGSLVITFSNDRDGYHIGVHDDGRGIDVARVAAKARAAGLCTDADLAARSREELLRLVFLDGVSTADAVTEISGRGVGMAAVQGAVRHAGGAIAIRSEPGAGTHVEILIPARPRAA